MSNRVCTCEQTDGVWATKWSGLCPTCYWKQYGKCNCDAPLNTDGHPAGGHDGSCTWWAANNIQPDAAIYCTEIGVAKLLKKVAGLKTAICKAPHGFMCRAWRLNREQQDHSMKPTPWPVIEAWDFSELPDETQCNCWHKEALAAY